MLFIKLVHRTLINVTAVFYCKLVFIGLHTLTLDVYDAVLNFNDGFINTLTTHKQLRLCKKSVPGYREIKKRKKATESVTKEASQVLFD